MYLNEVSIEAIVKLLDWSLADKEDPGSISLGKRWQEKLRNCLSQFVSCQDTSIEVK